MGQLLRLERVAELTSTPLATVRYWVQAGKLPAYKPGRHQLVKEEDLTAFLDASKVGGPLPVVKGKR
jgi:excisionase family DNA binding protein